jgi:superfamily II DNA or RNA helicase
VDLFDRLPDTTDPDALFAAFTGWTDERGISLYPAQEEALIALMSGDNVILATPTGSGKSPSRAASAPSTPPRSRPWCRRNSSIFVRFSAPPTWA